MTHIWIENIKYTQNDIFKDYICKKCGIETFTTKYNERHTYSYQKYRYDQITCDEFIIKKIIE